MLGKPNVYGSIFRFEGQASVFSSGEGPCYRCLFPHPPPPGLVPSCAEGGVLGVLPGLVGTIQATETLKLILGIGDTLVGRLLLIDTLGMRFHTVRIPRDPDCPACGTREIKALVDYEAFCGMPGGAVAKDSGRGEIDEITPSELAQRLAAHEDFTLIDVREPFEWQIGRIEGARLIPLGTLSDEMSTLDPAKEVVAYCRSGKRSADAVRQLAAAGFRATNVAGGILRWSDEVDPSIPKY
jgi:adenylyltransferase/sulfurtransferase